MSLKDIFKKTRNSAKDREQKALEWLTENLGDTSLSGTKVTMETALQVSAAYQAVNIISSQIAMLPFPVYKTQGASRIKDRGHPVYKLLNIGFNEYTTAYDGWRIAMINALLSDAGYILIERRHGMPVALYPIKSSRVTRRMDERTFEQRYIINFDTDCVEVNYADMIEIKGMTFDGKTLLNPIKLLRDVLGLSMAAEQYSSEYFKNGAHPSGAFEYPQKLGDPEFRRLQKSLSEKYTGLGKRHRVIILEDGAKFTRIAAPPQEGQMIESRKFQVIELARFFNIPPNKLMDYDRATWNNIEEMNIQFVNETLMPHLVGIEQLVNQQLIMPSEWKAGVYAEHNLEGLLRGKTSERYNAYAQARQWGWLSVNEIREKENMPNIGKQGDIFLTPVNMIDSSKISEQGGGQT